MLLAAIVWLAALAIAPDAFAGMQPMPRASVSTQIGHPPAAGRCHSPSAMAADDTTPSSCAPHAGGGTHACCPQAVPMAGGMAVSLPFTPQRRTAPTPLLCSRALPPPDEPPRA